jgi:hypothetical protein
VLIARFVQGIAIGHVTIENLVAAICRSLKSDPRCLRLRPTLI